MGILRDSAKDVLGVLGLGSAVYDMRNRMRYLFDVKTRARNDRFKGRCVPDGLPLPTPKLIYLVSGQFDAEAFYNSGAVGRACIEEILVRQGLEMSRFRSVLDFGCGCGCGRVLRHFKKLSGAKLHGVDYNPQPIKWCRRNLPFADFGVNRTGKPLPFPDESFDFIYSISVFTHLTESQQRFWMNELMRVLKRDGYMLFTVHGLSRLGYLSPEQRQTFEAGNVVMVDSTYSGTNHCGAYHPKQYVIDVLCRNWRLLAFEPGGMKDANQDAFLMQKP